MALDDEFSEIEKAWGELARADEVTKKSEQKLFEVYIAKIREGYNSFDREKRRGLIEKLNFFVSRLIDLPFDRIKATEVRTISGLSQEQLANKLGVGPQAICRIERAKTPAPYPLRKGDLKYLFWLKEHGYNPYNL